MPAIEGSREVSAVRFVNQLHDWFLKRAGYDDFKQAKAIVGVSGGKDSSVVAALCAKALGPDHVYGIMMPNQFQADIEDSIRICNILGIHSHTVNIGQSYKAMIDAIELSVGGAFMRDEAVKTNLPARLRMSVLYAFANGLNGRVIGTGNCAEAAVGYYTLWGDGACDFNPIHCLYVDEVIELGRQLGIPEDLLVKAPNDGMSGLPDEEKLGFTYADVKKFITWSPDHAMKDLGSEIYSAIEKKYRAAIVKNSLTQIPFAH